MLEMQHVVPVELSMEVPTEISGFGGLPYLFISVLVVTTAKEGRDLAGAAAGSDGMVDERGCNDGAYSIEDLLTVL